MMTEEIIKERKNELMARGMQFSLEAVNMLLQESGFH